MGTTAEKLTKLLDTKAAIKAALIEKGQSVSNLDTFASYPNKILAIPSELTASDDGKGNVTITMEGVTVIASAGNVSIE